MINQSKHWQYCCSEVSKQHPSDCGLPLQCITRCGKVTKVPSSRLSLSIDFTWYTIFSDGSQINFWCIEMFLTVDIKSRVPLVRNRNSIKYFEIFLTTLLQVKDRLSNEFASTKIFFATFPIKAGIPCIDLTDGSPMINFSYHLILQPGFKLA